MSKVKVKGEEKESMGTGAPNEHGLGDTSAAEPGTVGEGAAVDGRDLPPAEGDPSGGDPTKPVEGVLPHWSKDPKKASTAAADEKTFEQKLSEYPPPLDRAHVPPLEANIKTDGNTGTYEVLTAVSHDGADYAPGDTVTLNDKQAAQLIAVGAVRKLTEPSAEQQSSAEKAGADAQSRQEEQPAKRSETQRPNR